MRHAMFIISVMLPACTSNKNADERYSHLANQIHQRAFESYAFGGESDERILSQTMALLAQLGDANFAKRARSLSSTGRGSLRIVLSRNYLKKISYTQTIEAIESGDHALYPAEEAEMRGWAESNSKFQDTTGWNRQAFGAW